ncbi:MAG TPA: WG repeat-containing protein [Bacteroidia bacterium]|nr:WG repeat-containing protein [Bacteroidia bacterium]
MFLINRQGQEIAGPFDDLSEQSEQIYTVKLNNKYGALDIYGNYILQPRFDKLGDFKNGKAYYIDNGLYGFITKSGKTFSARYQWISDFDENNIAIVKMNGLYGLINDSDSLFLNARYELILKAEHSNFILVRNNKYGFYSSKNCFITDVDNEFKKELPVSYYTNGLAFKLIKNKKQAIMDANGKVSIEFGMFDEVYFAQNNLIRIKKKNKYGFTDRKLNIVIPCKYLEATDFKDSISIVKTKTETVLISTAGTEVFKTKGSLTRIFAHYFWVEEEEQNLLIDNKGKVLIENASGYSMVNLQQNDNAATYLIIELENKSKKIIKL